MSESALSPEIPATENSKEAVLSSLNALKRDLLGQPKENQPHEPEVERAVDTVDLINNRIHPLVKDFLSEKVKSFTLYPVGLRRFKLLSLDPRVDYVPNSRGLTRRDENPEFDLEHVDGQYMRMLDQEKLSKSFVSYFANIDKAKLVERFEKEVAKTS
ncbi:MAG: hypothetical protein A3B38_04335 [Candidatus Levybacteria bacterium RIFCSPLOWO2_01_FULL_36_13]|nr:MAG: hypothetical protein A2684_00080 [Candidatus Levybacteria bacterium RIFCSPHIGHO2_01_FULL_36_15b]OGH34057.1 MAG: hypothetical protein A3B38_04335 [Candidatus Levybacteria bacterium RIFCSPLOWO2_01_FULL_36_13]